MVQRESPYRCEVRPATNTHARLQALALMSHIQRWQHKDALSDPEQYLARASNLGVLANIKIAFVWDGMGGLVGVCFLGVAEGYDREKAKAEMSYRGYDGSVLDRPSVWTNYISWLVEPGEPTALPQEGMAEIWTGVAKACGEAFPEVEQMVSRARHHELWSVIYAAPPWEIIAELDLRAVI